MKLRSTLTQEKRGQRPNRIALLELLRQSMDNPKIFNLDGVECRATCRAELCRRFEPLSTCRLEDFGTAIWSVAACKDLPQRNDREFLWFMRGVLQLSWQLYLRTLPGP